MYDLIATCTRRIRGEDAIILIIPYNQLMNIAACHRRGIEIRMCRSSSDRIVNWGDIGDCSGRSFVVGSSYEIKPQ
jgi:hypothetical protein